MKSYLKLCTFLCNFSRSSLPPLPPKRSLSSYFSNRSKGQLKGQFWQIWLTTSNNGAGGNYLPLEGENVALSTLLDPQPPPRAWSCFPAPYEPERRGTLRFHDTSLKKSNPHKKRMGSLCSWLTNFSEMRMFTKKEEKAIFFHSELRKQKSARM